MKESVTAHVPFGAMTPPPGENVNGDLDVKPSELRFRTSARQRWGKSVGFVNVSVAFLQSPGTASPQSTTSLGSTSSAGEIPAPRIATRIVRSVVLRVTIS